MATINIDGRIFYPFEELENIKRLNDYPDKKKHDLYLDENGAGFRLSQLYIVDDLNRLGKLKRKYNRFYAILHHETGRVYKDVKTVASVFGFDYDAVNHVVNGTRQSVHGQHFSHIAVERDRKDMVKYRATIPTQGIDISNLPKGEALVRMSYAGGVKEYEICFRTEHMADTLQCDASKVRFNLRNKKVLRDNMIYKITDCKKILRRIK